MKARWAACYYLLFYPTQLGYFRQRRKAYGTSISHEQYTPTTHRFSEPTARPSPKAIVSRGFRATHLHGGLFSVSLRKQPESKNAY